MGKTPCTHASLAKNKVQGFLIIFSTKSIREWFEKQLHTGDRAHDGQLILKGVAFLQIYFFSCCLFPNSLVQAFKADYG